MVTERLPILTAAVSALAWVATLALCAPGSAQPKLPKGKDLRDVVKTKKGKEHRGRVLRLFDDKEIVLLQGKRQVAGGTAGGKRIRIPRSQVASTRTVNDGLREFFDRRKEAGDDRKKLWELVTWADGKGLDGMARLAALDLVLRQDDHVEAHEFLGHKKGAKGWRWRRKSSLMSRRKYEETIAKWGTALTIRTEHFHLKTDAGLRMGADVALELERIYLNWFQMFGKPLRLQEVISPMVVHLYRDIERFPSWTMRVKLAYYGSPQGGDVCNAFVSRDDGEPEQLTNVVTQQIIYHTVRGTPIGIASVRNHVSGWLEFGLGQWMESLFQGHYGKRKMRRPKLDPRQTGVLARMPDINIKPFLHTSYSEFLNYSKRTTERWALAAHLVTFLLEKDHGHRAAFLEYVRQVFQEGKGDSSTAFSEFLKVPMPELERKFIGWMQRQTGGGGPKKRKRRR